MSSDWIWGLHAIEACAENYPELILELVVETGAAPATKSHAQALAKQIGHKLKEQRALPGFLAEKRAQGFAARLKKFPIEDFRDYQEEFESDLANGTGQWAVLDALQDPRNYGAVLRSAAAFGVKAVIVGRKDQSPLTGVVAQASAGQAFRVRSVSASNLNQVAKMARDAGAHVLALDGNGKNLREWFAAKPQGAIVWVLGSEGEGVRSKLLETATQVLRLPMAPGVESLNASVAASLAFYEGSSLVGEGII